MAPRPLLKNTAGQQQQQQQQMQQPSGVVNLEETTEEVGVGMS